MKTYDRLFGSGPTGVFLGAVLFIPVYLRVGVFALPKITVNNFLRTYLLDCYRLFLHNTK